MQVAFNLAVGQERETSFPLGVGRSLDDVQRLVQRFCGTLAPRWLPSTNGSSGAILAWFSCSTRRSATRH